MDAVSASTETKSHTPKKLGIIYLSCQNCQTIMVL